MDTLMNTTGLRNATNGLESSDYRRVEYRLGTLFFFFLRFNVSDEKNKYITL